MPSFEEGLGNIPFTRDPTILKRKSRDYFWYSPILTEQLAGFQAEFVVMPRNEADVIDMVRACYTHRVPCTVRGAGTGNYGQSVPLQGGVVMDSTTLDEIEWIRPGHVRCGAGVRMAALEQVCVSTGAGELRLFPSTVRTATIGGFIAGGSTGIGGVTWGLLQDPGNVIAARVVTMEGEPRVLELRGDEVPNVVHAYGTTGIITAVEMPLAPVTEWVDQLIHFGEFMDAARFAQTICERPDLQLRLCSLVAAPVPQLYFGRLGNLLPKGRHALLLTVRAEDLSILCEAVHHCTGAAISEAASGYPRPLYEYSWNHTTLQALKVDRTVTYLQVLFSGSDHLKDIEWAYRRFGDEVPMHLEFIRLGADIRCFGLQLLRYSGSPRLQEIMSEIEESGCPVFNPHAVTLEEGGMKQVDRRQLAFKINSDPMGLLNPGKMLAWNDGRFRSRLGGEC